MPEEMQRKIELIIEHHAQFAVDIERLKERQGKATKDIDALVSLMARLEKAQERTDGQLAELAEIVKGTETGSMGLSYSRRNTLPAATAARRLREPTHKLRSKQQLPGTRCDIRPSRENLLLPAPMI